MSFSYMNVEGSDYRIESIDRLENSAGNLASYNQQLTNDADSLKYIMNSIESNWENSEGQDIQSIMKNISDAIAVLSESIQPVIATYIENLNTIVAETKVNQSRTIDN